MVQIAWTQLVPKVELHLHLEGAIPLEALWALLCKYGGTQETPTMDHLTARFRYRDFSHFIETWRWKNQYLQEYEDFEFIAEAVARDLRSQNIKYVEAFYSPPDFHQNGLETQRITEALRTGLAKVDGVEVLLVADLVRSFGPDAGYRTLAELEEVRSLGVVGIGLGGREQGYPPRPYAEVYEKARRLGFRTSVHAGEAVGPESVWEALDSLKPDRIGHATRAVEDPGLVDRLDEDRVPLELCPISNLRTRVVDSIDNHPIRSYFDRGLRITVNTDDPKMFNNSLAEEYDLLIDSAGFSPKDIQKLILNAVDVSWSTPERRSALQAELTDDPHWYTCTC